MGARTRTVRALLAVAIAATGCGGAAKTGHVATGPAPEAMCGTGESPAVAAYDRATGAFEWSVCTPDSPVRRYVLGLTDEAVFVDVVPSFGEEHVAAYDIRSGAELPDGGPSGSRPSLPDRSGPAPAVVFDGVRLEGGQGDPTTAVDDSTGKVLWTQPGSPAYDDVWAVGDGAVFVATHTNRLVAYELRSGKVRWDNGLDPNDETWPWLVDGDELFTIWSNLDVISTHDGTIIWRTQYPRVPFPRMTGVRANSDTVFVAFSTVQSGGD